MMKIMKTQNHHQLYKKPLSYLIIIGLVVWGLLITTKAVNAALLSLQMLVAYSQSPSALDQTGDNKVNSLDITVGGQTPTITPTVTPTGQPQQEVIVGAGDISTCGGNADEATAKLLDGFPGATVFTSGDNAYPDGSTANFTDCYQPTWGRHQSRTRPSPGNHDYHTSGAAG